MSKTTPGNAVNLGATYEQEELHDSWKKAYRNNPIQDRFNDHLMDRIIATLKPPPDALFLDAGCGDGHNSIRIAKRGYICIGIDVSKFILKQAQANVIKANLEGRVSLQCQGLEDLAFEDGLFDVIHCRGVLMHIPRWEQSLANLCRVLKPQGKIVIAENNHRSLEANLQRLARHLRANISTLRATPGGFEYWSEVQGRQFLVRVANIGQLTRSLDAHGIRRIQVWPMEFWDIGRLPAGITRNAAIRFNRCWFSLRLPAFLSSGNVVIGEKYG